MRQVAARRPVGVAARIVERAARPSADTCARDVAERDTGPDAGLAARLAFSLEQRVRGLDAFRDDEARRQGR